MVLYLLINLVALLLQSGRLSFQQGHSWELAGCPAGTPCGRRRAAKPCRMMQHFETGIMTNEIDSLSHFAPPPTGSPLQR
jgi:hypothetical protein